jgi:D-amino peptidase
VRATTVGLVSLGNVGTRADQNVNAYAPGHYAGVLVNEAHDARRSSAGWPGTRDHAAHRATQTAVDDAQAAAAVPTVVQIAVRRVGFDAASMTDVLRARTIVAAIASAAIEGAYG